MVFEHMLAWFSWLESLLLACLQQKRILVVMFHHLGVPDFTLSSLGPGRIGVQRTYASVTRHGRTGWTDGHLLHLEWG